MGNWWTGVSADKLSACEENLMRLNNMHVDDFTIRNIRLDDDHENENFIHETHVKGTKENLPKLLMIHGYLSGGV